MPGPELPRALDGVGPRRRPRELRQQQDRLGAALETMPLVPISHLHLSAGSPRGRRRGRPASLSLRTMSSHARDPGRVDRRASEADLVGLEVVLLDLDPLAVAA